MKTKSISHIRQPQDRKHFLANLAINLWFPGAKAEIDKTGSAKRKAQWATLNPWNMKIEPPIIFDSEKFTSCIVDRKAGILLTDKEVPLITFETFLKESNGGTTGVKTDVTLSDLYALVQNPNKLSAKPVFYLANIDGSEDYTVIYDSKSEVASLDKLVSGIFRDYDFESITISALEKTDDAAQKLAPSETDIESFYTGDVSFKDRLLIEKSGSFKFIDLNLLANVVSAAKRNKAAEPAKQNKPKAAQRDNLL